MNLRTIDIKNVPNLDEVWSRVVAAAPQAWCWHTKRWYESIKAASRDQNPSDLTFFVFDGSTPVGLCPLLVCDIQDFGQVIRDASYYGGPLPWPCAIAELDNDLSVERFLFAESERRAREAGAERIRYASSSPLVMSAPNRWFEPITLEFNYLDASYDSHLANVDSNILQRVRKRYRQYVRKYIGHFECEIVKGIEVDESLEQHYFDLHVKDAGGQFRPRESYSRIADLARFGEGFFVTARHKSSGVLAGVLFISVVKGAAFDSSVAVDPDFQDYSVSHLLKWRAIEHLQDIDVSHYELGRRQVSATLQWVPNSKTRGISFFKDGWARGDTKRVYVAEKMLTKDGLKKHLQSKQQALCAYYGF